MKTQTVLLTVLYLVLPQSQADIHITNHVIKGQELEVNEHESLTLECESTTRHVTWSLNGDRLSNTTDRFLILDEETDTGLISRLQLLKAEPDDAGNYGCFCHHSGFKDEINVKVVGHQHHSHVIIDGPRKLRSELGSELQLACKADIHSDVEWFANEKLVTNTTRDRVTETLDESRHSKTVVLVRKNLEKEDFGEYRCQNAKDAHDKALVKVDQRTSEKTALRGGARQNEISVIGATVVTVMLKLIAIAQH